MAAPVVVFRGLATVEGTVGAYDAIISGITQNAKLTQNFEEEVIKDVHGYDAAWLFRNENATFDCTLTLCAVVGTNTAAAAAAPASSTGGAVISALGQPFFAVGTTLILSAFTMTACNGTFQVMSGSDLDLGNAKAGTASYKLRKYANSNQQTAIAAVPT